MGIKDLYSVIESIDKNLITTHNLSEFIGYRFAIDISVFLYKYIRSAGPERWINIFIIFLCSLKKNGIRAICIFDGPNVPKEKKDEQIRRRGEAEKLKSRLKECEETRDYIRNNILKINANLPEDIKAKCRSLICRRGPKFDRTDYNDANDVLNSLIDVIEKLRFQTLDITKAYSDKAKVLINALGLHSFDADGEAETLCAYFAVNGIVDAVMTEDTDVLAYGVPLMVSYRKFKLGDGKLSVVKMENVLEAMDITQSVFTDLCILLSCDYNCRVMGYPNGKGGKKKPIEIGAKRALSMIQNYGGFEDMLEYIENPEMANYERCRELFFVPKNIEEELDIPSDNMIDVFRLESFIKENNINISMDYILECNKTPEINFESDSEEEDDFKDLEVEGTIIE